MPVRKGGGLVEAAVDWSLPAFGAGPGPAVLSPRRFRGGVLTGQKTPQSLAQARIFGLGDSPAASAGSSRLEQPASNVWPGKHGGSALKEKRGEERKRGLTDAPLLEAVAPIPEGWYTRT
ncbi:hypothetical protein PPACK8108_LOCUS25028 [Phakopsora pachyrhizi]|uniref:Uncharacterized protein n=1 Tax=Phakopsora pachyrhizi TaxID=170000 RepID=A0AAV0BU86_PHAPC|nr:hypothetical protein PPACK8108_LOCUS25028 [Phakopsora pachyrhizi]